MKKNGENNTQSELDLYEMHADSFFQLWVDLHGRSGVTKYIHMIVSGHMLEYMLCWGNLTKYSQQGWESLNALIKLFFFRRTNKGGSKANVKSKLIPIGQLMHRRFFWICNLVPTNIWDAEFDIDDVTVEDEMGDDIVFGVNIDLEE